MIDIINKSKTAIFNHKGFTLAETLITLVIVGIIAALTIPALIAKYQEQETITRLKSTYSILSQALKMAEIHNGKIQTWDIGVRDTLEGAQKLYDYIAPEISKLQVCGTESGCFADNYLNLQGNPVTYQPSTWSRNVRFRLANGTSVLIYSDGTGCLRNIDSSPDARNTKLCGSFLVDINGDRKPNKAGYDYFIFMMTDEGVLPGGLKNHVKLYGGDCNHSSTAGLNGLYCTAWVLYKNNFDYKNKDIQWD